MDADVIVVGAGPAGLHAALKAAVLNHSVLVLDKGLRYSRVSQAPALANVPGRPGVSGMDLLLQGRRDLERFESQAGKRLVTFLEPAEAVALRRTREGYEVEFEHAGERKRATSPVVVLATGIVDRKPGLESFDERGHHTLASIARTGVVGYCLLCEGWRLEGRRVAILGWSRDAVSIANDVQHQFGGNATLLTDGAEPEDAPRVQVDARPIARLHVAEGRLHVHLEDGEEAHYDMGILSLGIHRVNSDLARMVGAATTGDGFVRTDGNCEVLDEDGGRIEGLFAIGDVRADQWKQVVVAWGDAETAILAAYAHRLPARPGRAPAPRA